MIKAILLSLLVGPLAWAGPLKIEKIENVKLEKPMKFYWEKEQPMVSNVSIVTAQVDAKLLKPSEGYEPIFLINDRVAEKVKVLPNGRVVFVSPQKVIGTPVLWVGPQMLPEQVDRETAQRLFRTHLLKNFETMAKKKSSESGIQFSSAPFGKKELTLSEEKLYEKAKSIQ